MNHFQVELYEPKPIAMHVLHGRMDLRGGKNVIEESPKGEGLIFERLHTTGKSKLTFSAAEKKEGVLYFYFIILDNGNSYLYIVGETNERPIIRGGSVVEIEGDGQNASAVVRKYIEGKSKKFADLYAQTESPALINALNKCLSELQNLMP